MQTTLIRTIISHAVALPTQVLMPSIVCRKLWTLMGAIVRREGSIVQSTIRVARPNGALLFRAFSSAASDLLGRAVGAPIMVIRHLAAHHRVLLPLRRPLGERELRLQDFLEQRIFSRFLLDHLVVDLELLLENGVRRLVELDVVLGLQLL